MKWTIEQKYDAVHIMKTELIDRERRRILILSDVHFDSPECDRRLLTQHLDYAKEIGAPVIIIGDWFDSMRSTGDRRMTHGAREGLDRLDYLDALVDDSAKYLEAYKDIVMLITQGNHESAMTKHHNTNLTARLATRIGCEWGPYRGWLICGFTRPNSALRLTLKIYYDHGSGGSAPVTRGVIKTNRRAVMLPDADVVISGHIHERWIVEVPRIKLLRNYKTDQRSQIHASSGTYKKEDLSEGWAAEKGFGPAALGGLWLDVWRSRDASLKAKTEHQLEYSISYA